MIVKQLCNLSADAVEIPLAEDFIRHLLGRNGIVLRVNGNILADEHFPNAGGSVFVLDRLIDKNIPGRTTSKQRRAALLEIAEARQVDVGHKICVELFGQFLGIISIAAVVVHPGGYVVGVDDRDAPAFEMTRDLLEHVEIERWKIAFNRFGCRAE